VIDEDPVRVLLADNDRPFADALAALLMHGERLEVVGHAQDGAEAVMLAESLRPDVVLIALAVPGLAGVEATRRIRETHPETLVLVLTDEAASADVRAASEAGAAGFLTKECLSTEFAPAILGLAAFAGVARR
jgi:DNA-binding NarL/FixJ family response regulator